MSKATKEFIEMVKNEHSGSPPPSENAMSRFFNEIGTELKHKFEHGAHESAAALFNGSAFVMYPHAGKENQSLYGPTVEQPQVLPPEQDLGGMER